MLFRFLVLTGALCLLGAAAQAQDSFIPNDATINNAIAGDAWVGWNADPPTTLTSPTVSLVAGGSVGGSVRVFNSSTFNLIDGSIGMDLVASSDSTVNITGGSLLGALRTHASSTVNIAGGSIGSIVDILDSSTVNVSGGSNGGYADVEGTLNLFGTGLTSTKINDTDYRLNGWLSDGTDVSGTLISLNDEDPGEFHLINAGNAVPEPGSYALLLGMSMMSAGILVRRRRK